MLLFSAKVLVAPVEAKLAKLQALLADPGTHQRALVPAVEPTLAAAKANAPVHEGGLAESIHTEIVGGGLAAVAVRTSLPYSWMRERGGEIVPVNAAMLHWFDYGGGEHFWMHVHQEGTSYMERAYEETRLSIPPLYLKGLLAQIEGLA